MRVYRLEDKDGSGPYRPRSGYKPEGGIQERVSDAHNRDIDGHPSGTLDFNWRHLSDDEDRRYACDSFEGLLHWFEGFIDELLDNGYDLVVYDVPDHKVIAGYSGLQVIFKYDAAVKVAA